MILFEDGDIDLAVEKSVRIKFYNSGQVCNNINRFLIHKSVHDIFVKKFRVKMGQLKLSPLINKTALEKVERLITDAKQKGATVIGGRREGLFFEPTLLTHMTKEMAMYHTEIFGPVAPVYSFSSEEEAIQMANDTDYGLAAYFFTKDSGRQWRVAEALEAGSVGVNTTDIYSELLPFGGWKQSGLSREMGLEKSLDDFLEIKSLVIGINECYGVKL